MDVRRVVTGHDEKGRAIFVSDEPFEPVTLKLMPGAEYHRIWGSNEVATFPDDGAPPAQPTFFPPVGGYRFFFVTMPPQMGYEPDPDLDLEEAQREMEEKLPGGAAHLEEDAPGMHTTDTVDFEVILAGELTLELDDGAEKVLRVGDVNIQNGTRHRWHNRGDKPATMACFLVGANRKKR